MAEQQHIVLYDFDCGFCRWSLSKILDWDRAKRLRPLPIQSVEGQELLDEAGVPDEQRLRSWHLVHPDGKVESAGAAFPALFRLLPAGAPVALLTKGLPGVAQRGYMLVANNRTVFGRPLTQGMKDRATAKIASRGPQDAVFATGASCEVRR